MLESYPEYQRKARSLGVPVLGAGAIYPFEESSFVIDPIRIPEHWPKGYGMDVGWNKTAGLFGAHDQSADILYLWSEHYLGQSDPVVHTHGIKSRGDWLPGKIDPASRGRGQIDGRKLFQVYQELGLNISEANNTVGDSRHLHGGIYEVYMRFSQGRIKVFSSLTNFLSEIRIYRRDENGKIVKQHDHLMDCLRYMVVDGVGWMETQPEHQYQQRKGYGWQV